MKFIKLDAGVYVNLDHVVSIEVYGSGTKVTTMKSVFNTVIPIEILSSMVNVSRSPEISFKPVP